LFTGDLTDFGRADEYANLARLIAPLPMPAYLMAGNHDEPAAMRAAFPLHSYMHQREGKLDYVVDDFPVRIVALDSTIPHKSPGLLTREQLAWLDATLSAAPGNPAIVALHHPPFWTGIGHMDTQPLTNPDELAAVIRRHPQVERVIAGHLHRPIVT